MSNRRDARAAVARQAAADATSKTNASYVPPPLAASKARVGPSTTAPRETQSATPPTNGSRFARWTRDRDKAAAMAAFRKLRGAR